MKILLHLIFGGVFVYAGAVKAWNPQAFLEDVRSFDLLPDPLAAWVAMGLPWLEIFAGLAVASGVLRKGGLLILNGALLAFLGGIGSAWYRGIDIRCGCFGASTATSNYVELIVRDVALLALGVFLLLRRQLAANRLLLPN
jgi:putative oxidoreductase